MIRLLELEAFQVASLSTDMIDVDTSNVIEIRDNSAISDHNTFGTARIHSEVSKPTIVRFVAFSPYMS